MVLALVPPINQPELQAWAAPSYPPTDRPHGIKREKEREGRMGRGSYEVPAPTGKSSKVPKYPSLRAVNGETRRSDDDTLGASTANHRSPIKQPRAH